MKHLNSISSSCILCNSYLSGYKLIENPKHVYNPGIFYECNCKKSTIWTNSVRNEESLISFLEGKSDRYYRGFCNDLFCGKCFNYFLPLKNGYPYQGERLDLYGCSKCNNKNVVINIRLNDPEGGKTTNKLIETYKRLYAR